MAYRTFENYIDKLIISEANTLKKEGIDPDQALEIAREKINKDKFNYLIYEMITELRKKDGGVFKNGN